MGIVEAITIGMDLATKFAKNEDLKKFVCGTYGDGTPKSIYDAVTGETESPKQKEKRIKQSKKKRKKMKKKKYKKFYL